MSKKEIKKLIIIGSGPSGYTAGIYASRAKIEPLLFAGDQFGGQLMFTTEVENFPGFEEGVMGPKLMMDMRKQMLRFGGVIKDKNVVKVDFDKSPFEVSDGEDVYFAETVLISTGAKALTLKLENEDKYIGRGVSTCAVCDAAFFNDKVVIVVGGGDSAVEDAMALTKFARKVYVAVRRGELRASKIMQDRVMNNEKVEILWNTEVVGIEGDGRVERVKLKNNKTMKQEVRVVDGLFYAIGHVPSSQIFAGKVERDKRGYVLTGLNGLKLEKSVYETWKEGYMTMTSVPGVFASGDVVDFRYRQAVTAAGFGTMAALDIEKYLEMGK